MLAEESSDVSESSVIELFQIKEKLGRGIVKQVLAIINESNPFMALIELH